MSKSPLPRTVSLAPPTSDTIDAACNRFEAAWQGARTGGPQPRIEDHLNNVPEAERWLLLQELILLELYYRTQAGEQPTVAEYLPRFAGLNERWLQRKLHRELAAARKSPQNRPPGADTGASPMAEPLEPPGPVGALPRVPGYDLLGVLGEGGMGIVYKARHLALNRVVALKMIRAAEYTTGSLRDRFRGEGEALARLHHPHIVQIYEVGEHNGLPYMAMELCPGGSLEKQLDGSPWAAAKAADLVQTLARATHAAHAASLVHRDLKPGNVLLAADGAWKITDFGLAKRLDVPGQTHTHVIVGTPEYMAPEQAISSKSVTASADVYALGAILYELLTGRPPFKAAAPMDTILQLLAEDPVPVRRLQSMVPRDLEMICHKCLEKDAGMRFSSALALAEELRRFRAGEPLESRPPGTVERLLKWVRRRPVWATLIAVSFLAAVGLLVLSVSLWRSLDEEKKATNEAKIAERKATFNEKKANEKTDEANAARQEANDNAALANAARRASEHRLASQLFTAGDLLQIPDIFRKEDHAEHPLGPAFEERYHGRMVNRARLLQDCAFAGAHGPLAFTPDGGSLLLTGKKKADDPGWWLRYCDVASGKISHEWELNPTVPSLPTPITLGSSDGRMAVAAATGDTEATVYEGIPGPRLRRLKFRHPARLSALALSANCRVLATAGGDTILLRDVASGKELQRLDVSPPDPSVLLLAADGKRLLAQTEVFGRIWDLTDKPAMVQVYLPVAAAQFSPRGSWVVLKTGAPGSTFLWDSGGEMAQGNWEGTPFTGRAAAMSPDEQKLAVADTTGMVRVWDVPTRRLRTWFHRPGPPAAAVAFSPDVRRQRLAVAGSSRWVAVLDATTRIAPQPLAAGPGAAGPVAWSPDGRTAAVACTDGAIRLLDGSGGKTRQVLRGLTDAAALLAFSPDGRTLAAACDPSHCVRQWDVESGRPLATCGRHTGGPIAIAYSGDSRLLVCSTVHGLWFFDRRRPQEWGRIDAGKRLAQVLVATSDGKKLLTTEDDAGLNMWDLSGPPFLVKPVATVAGVKAGAMAIAPDGKSVLTAGADGVRRWDLGADNRLTPSREPLDKGLLAAGGGRLGFSPDGEYVLSVPGGLYARATAPGSNRYELLVQGPSGWRQAAMTADRRIVASADDESLFLFDLDKAKRILTDIVPLGRVESLAFGPNNTLLTGAQATYLRGTKESFSVFPWARTPYGTRSRDSTSAAVRLWDGATGAPAAPQLPSREVVAPPSRVAWSADGRWVAAGGEDGSVWLWDRDSPKAPDRLFVSPAAKQNIDKFEKLFPIGALFTPWGKPEFADGEPVAAVAFSPDNVTLAAVGNKGTLRVWRVEGGQEQYTWNGKGEPAVWVGFSTDGRLLELRGDEVWVREAAMGGVLFKLRDEPGAKVRCAAASPQDSELLAVATDNRKVLLWDLHKRQKRPYQFVGHQDEIEAVAFSPDGRTLATGGLDRTVRLWTVATAQEVGVLGQHRGPVRSLAFSPDGNTLASGGDGEAYLWRTDDGP